MPRLDAAMGLSGLGEGTTLQGLDLEGKFPQLYNDGSPELFKGDKLPELNPNGKYGVFLKRHRFIFSPMVPQTKEGIRKHPDRIYSGFVGGDEVEALMRAYGLYDNSGCAETLKIIEFKNLDGGTVRSLGRR